MMKDLAIALENRPGALAEMGEALGRAGVSIEGGGAWVVGGQGVAHFLFADGTAARQALEEAGIHVLAERDVLVQRLKQDVPGQLGSLTRRLTLRPVKLITTSHPSTSRCHLPRLTPSQRATRHGRVSGQRLKTTTSWPSR